MHWKRPLPWINCPPSPPFATKRWKKRRFSHLAWIKILSFKTKRFCLVLNTPGQKKWTFWTRTCLCLATGAKSTEKKWREFLVLLLPINLYTFSGFRPSCVTSSNFRFFFSLGVELTGDACILSRQGKMEKHLPIYILFDVLMRRVWQEKTISFLDHSHSRRRRRACYHDKWKLDAQAAASSYFYHYFEPPLGRVKL